MIQSKSKWDAASNSRKRDFGRMCTKANMSDIFNDKSCAEHKSKTSNLKKILFSIKNLEHLIS